MPVNNAMMADMKRRYGKKKGQNAYYAVERKRKKKKNTRTGYHYR